LIELNESRVAILLSVFNGEKYLDEQLASYVAQTHTNWLLYWRDDGSTDGSATLIDSFRCGPGKGKCVSYPGDGRMQTTGSFLALLKKALLGPASFFAFSDQDDIWLPKKLARGVAALKKLPSHRPALFFCARTPVNVALHPIGPVPLLHNPIGFPAALTQNIVPGCCMMLNRVAAELISASEVPAGTWHDWWCYLVVSAYDGLIIAGDAPDILYRQHATSLIGEPRGFWRRAVAATRRGRTPFMTLFWSHVSALLSLSKPLPNKTHALLETLDVARQDGLLARVKALSTPGLVRQTWAETLLFRVWFILG
jgi:hypothetical protein